jgi:hypothetical protein
MAALKYELTFLFNKRKERLACYPFFSPLLRKNNWLSFLSWALKERIIDE